jgi:proteasome lid subunit RPN8/RPN11
MPGSVGQEDAGIWLHPDHWERMREDVDRKLPEEACGLVAGRAGHSLVVYPVVNVLRSPVRFRMQPQEQVDALLEMERQGWGLLAIYHSHPAGPPQPSPTDLAEAAYPEAAYLIWFRTDDGWSCRAYRLQAGGFDEIPINFVRLQ